MEAPNQDSSDEMIDIQIEESLVRESLMKIDTSNFNEDVIILVFYFLLLTVSAFIGGFSAPSVFTTEFSRPLGKVSIFDIDQNNLVSMNRFLSYSVQLTYVGNNFQMNKSQFFSPFQLSNDYLGFDDNNSSINLSITYEAKCYKNSKHIYSANKKFDKFSFHNHGADFVFVGLTFFKDNIIDYDTIKMHVIINLEYPETSILSPSSHFMNENDKTFNKNLILMNRNQLLMENNNFADLYNVTIISKSGNVMHTISQIGIRLIFIFIQLFIFLYFFSKLKVTQVRFWHLEQKLTIPLLFITILYDNPFYLFQFTSPSYVYMIMDSLVSAVYSSYFRFFILVLFDSLRYKNRKTDTCFFIPKVVFILLLFLSTVVHSLYDTIQSFDSSQLLIQSMKQSFYIDNVEYILRIFEAVMYFLYLMWFAISVAYASLQVDITERYKFNMYSASSVTALIVLAVVYYLCNFIEFFENSAIYFVVSFITQNTFVLLMTFFHWPYEIIDSAYDDPSKQEENQDRQTNEFFNNEPPIDVMQPEA
ncbi:hypothetical protein TRFO_33946 [Tritrichomonas foetus]|uniref:Wntless-like transmembrane domain-containing protein n=1 Tax=Tritrichomonas foetus TaxID=1144522 RepID=A0A1J4JMB9_9EUKA|nr:hypothetical protein TRFO_33946 [Tritrichomonas foetus]|eukprot:OHS99575.1 hypothetical protein TRFO_33946 [Tritrichomonas foetus]